MSNHQKEKTFTETDKIVKLIFYVEEKSQLL